MKLSVQATIIVAHEHNDDLVSVLHYYYSAGLPNGVVYPVRSVFSSLPTFSLTHPFMWKNSINHHVGDHRNVGEHSTQIFRSRIFHTFTVHYLPLVCLPFFLSLGLSPRDIPTVLKSSITALSARCKFRRLEEWRSLLARPYGRVINERTIPEALCKRGTPHLISSCS